MLSRPDRRLLLLLLLTGAAWPSGATATPSATTRAEVPTLAAEVSAPLLPTLRRMPSPEAALRAVLRQEQPLVLGLGEYHQREGERTLPSSLHRFIRQLLPRLARRASDLVIETWITDGSCGASERQVVSDVAQTIKRPARTEDEILTLVKRAQRYRIRPQILTLSCGEYERLLAPGAVDYAGLLALTTRKLRDKIEALVRLRTDPARRAVDDALRGFSGGGVGGRDLILVYGGALHNELHPTADNASLSYGPAVSQATGDHYVELDLFVPEYIEAHNSLLREESWFPLFERASSPRHTLLIERAARSYVIIFPRQRSARGERQRARGSTRARANGPPAAR